MSRLASFIRRLEAQRASLDAAAALVRELPGLVLELGLGNGRTYDHLRTLLPDHRIIVFERELATHATCVPPEADLVLGPVEETLTAFARAFPEQAVLAHADLGSGRLEPDAALSRLVAAVLPAAMAPGGLVLSDQRLDSGALCAVALVPGLAHSRYHHYRKPRFQALPPSVQPCADAPFAAVSTDDQRGD